MNLHRLKNRTFTRREFVITGSVGTLALASGMTFSEATPVVSVVRIKNDNIERAVNEAIDLLGGIRKVTGNKERIMLKPPPSRR
jgi:hypothetical protein